MSQNIPVMPVEPVAPFAREKIELEFLKIRFLRAQPAQRATGKPDVVLRTISGTHEP
jgi:hypothetical protein